MGQAKGQIILFGGSKGGTGKSTICGNMAVMRQTLTAERGGKVTVIDTDKQATLNTWNEVRDAAGISPHINVIQKIESELKTTIDYQMKILGSTDVLIDAGGRDNKGLRSGMVCCDKLITPVQASQFDLWTLEKLNDLYEDNLVFNPNMKVYVLINRASTHIYDRDADAAKELIAQYPHFHLMETVLHDRAIYRQATYSGLSVLEMKNAAPKAKAEISNLYSEIFND